MRREGRRPPHAVDIAVGANIRRMRRSMNLSQEALGIAVGLTFQQIQKYERGANRVSASMLYEIGRVLKCEPAQLMSCEAHEPAAGWMADARWLHERHPQLFPTLIRLPEDRLSLLLACVQAMEGTPGIEIAEAGAESVNR